VRGSTRRKSPQLAVQPRHARDEALGFDRLQDRARLRIEAVDLARAVLADPQRAFGPGEAGAAAVRCRDARQDGARVGIDLLDAAVRDLVQVAAVERGARVRLDREGALHPAAVGIDRVQAVAGREPQGVAIEGDAMHGRLVVEGSVLADDMGRCRFHMAILLNTRRRGE
jgi:hypothetical protein